MTAAPLAASPSRRRAYDAVVVVTLMTLCGLGSLWLGQDVNVDLQNYHFFNGYAFVTQRLARDIAPAATWSFLSPLMDGFHYWGMSHLPARLFGFLLGALHGLNPALVYLIARAVFPAASETRRLAAAVAGLFAALGPDAVVLLGTSTGDSLAAIPVLAAILAAVHASRGEERRPASLLAAAGLLAGIAVAFKLTSGPYVVALGVALVWTAAGLRDAAATAAVFGASAGAGYLATGGFWCVYLWRRVGNPVFPFANSLFHSPYLASFWLRDETWKARTLWDHVSPPFLIAAGRTERLQDFFQFRDARLLALVAAALLFAGRFRSRRSLARSEKLLLAIGAVGYVLWLEGFYYYRYGIVLELLIPLALYLLLRASFPHARPRQVDAAYLGLIVALTSFARFPPRAVGRGAEWVPGWFDVRPPRIATLSGAVVLTELSNSFVFPFLPADDRFFRVYRSGQERLTDEVRSAVAGHRGPILYFQPIGAKMLAPLGLREAGHCERLDTSRGEFRICLAERATAP